VTLPTYDTGLTAPQRTLLRHAIVARFAPMLKSNGGFLRALGSVPRTVRGRSDEDLGWICDAINSATPAIIVGLGRADYESIGTTGLEWAAKLEVAIYVASSNARGVVSGRLESDVQAQADPTADPGIEVMLELAQRQMLLGQDLDIATTHEFRMKSEEEVETFQPYTIWEQIYTVEIEVEINPNRNVTQLVTSVDVNDNLNTDGATDLTVETITNLEAP